MAVLEVVSAAVAAASLLWRLAGNEGLPPAVGDGMELWRRLNAVTRNDGGRKKIQKAIDAALAGPDFASITAGDRQAADDAVGRALADLPADTKLRAAVRNRGELDALLADPARRERAKLFGERAEAAFDAILAATKAYLVDAAAASPDFATLAHQEELRSLGALIDEFSALSAKLNQIPAETVRLLAGRVLTLNPPVKPTGHPIEPSRLLAPTSGAFPFVDRGGLLRQLVDWVDGADGLSVQIVGGAGGSGKSRLAVELCRELAGRGSFWSAGFLGSGVVDKSIQALAATAGGRLVVVDYAETRALEVAELIEQLALSGTGAEPVRVLLLVRNSASAPPGADDTEQWRRAVRAVQREEANSHIDDAGCTLLNDEPLPADERRTLFLDAVTKLPAYLGDRVEATACVDDTGFLDSPEFAQPLNLALAAYLFLAEHGKVVYGASALFDGTLTHEAKYWRSNAALDDTNLNLGAVELSRLVALATLTDAVDEAEAHILLGLKSFLPGDVNAPVRRAADRFLRGLYPSEEHRWGQLLPDRLGEHLVARELGQSEVTLSEAVRYVLDPARDPDQLVRPLRTLARACADRPALADAVASVLDHLLVPLFERCRVLASGREYMLAAPMIEALTTLIPVVGKFSDLDTLERCAFGLDQGNRVTVALGLESETVVVDRFRGLAKAAPAYTPDLAASLSRYAVRLGGVGRRDEEVGPASEAVTLQRKLAEANPAAYTPDLALSLSNYAVSLRGVGRREEALDPAFEALTLRRELAEANPAAYTPDLAMSLNNCAVMLGEVGKREEALGPAFEAVTLYRELAEASSAAYTPGLAMSLNTYANSLAGVGRREEALGPAFEAVTLYRELAQANPAAYTPDLAMSLNTYANSLAGVGRREEVLDPAFEAVTLYRELAEASSAAYTPDLAIALANYAVRLAEVGRREEALGPASEAVTLRRELAQANPAAYTPDLAGSLHNYAISLAEVGRREEALGPALEAVTLRQELAQANPAAYAPDLAGSLHNYAKRLAEVGRGEEALGPAFRAVTIYRLLAEANPGAYRDNYLQSLRNIAWILDELGQSEEAALYREEIRRIQPEE